MDNLKIPRAEHPNPQFERKNWINLNGEWEFERDREEKGLENGFVENPHLAEKITVPFCMESKLSGIEDTDFCECVWYKKAITLYPDFTERQVGLRRFSDVLRTLVREHLLTLKTDESGNMLVHIL